MRHEVYKRLLNVSLRSLSLVSRFALLFVLARLLPPAEVGLYGLIAATLSFSVLVIGGDYYTYSQRELMARHPSEWSFVLQHQFLAIALLYVVLIPLQGLVFIFDLLPNVLIIWFFALLVVEHLAQELNRLLIAMQRPLSASLVLFIRSGLWIWVVVPLMWLYPEIQQLNSVFYAWFLGSAASVLLGGYIVCRSVPKWHWSNIDWKWLKLGYKKGLMFLIATMCFRALLTVDRYVVEHLSGAEMLGAYVVYAGMAVAIVNFMEPAIFSFLYPRLVKAWHQGEYITYRKVLRELSISSVFASIGLGISCAFLAPLVLQWTGKSIYLEQLPLLWVLLVAAVIYALGMVPHYALYAKNADRIIMLAHVSSLVVFAFIVALFNDSLVEFTAPCALLGAFTWMGGVKLFAYTRLKSAPVINA